MIATDQSQTDSNRADDALRDVTRYVPAPHTAPELAAMEASLVDTPRVRYANGARILSGVAVVALAVAMPDLSRGAMGVPEARVTIDNSPEILPAAVWTPAMHAGLPLYDPADGSDPAAPENPTFASRPRLSDFDRVMPVAVLESGTERFDLAFAGGFAGVELEQPSLTGLTVRTPRPARPAPAPARLRSQALRTRMIEIPQINAVAGLEPIRAARPGSRDAIQAETRPAPVSVVSRARDLATTSAPIEAALAGPVGLPDQMRRARPVPQQVPPPIPVRDAPARAVPAVAPPVSVSAEAAREAVIVPKSKLDARINGVLAGSVEFQQLDGTIAIRLRSVVNMLRDRFSDEEFAHLISGAATNRFVTLAELKSAGIPISYNPAYDEIEFGIDYQDAPNSKKVQVQQISTPGAVDQTVMIEQIPR